MPVSGFAIALQIPPEALWVAYQIAIACACLFAVIVLWLILRKFRGERGDSFSTNGIDFLDSAKNKGALTDDEARLVRDATLRQMMAREDTTRLRATLSDLKAIAGQDAAPPSDTEDSAAKTQPAPAPEAPPAPAPAEAAPEPAAPPPPATASPGGVDIDTLFEKGLIEREEYERLSGLMRQAQTTPATSAPTPEETAPDEDPPAREPEEHKPHAVDLDTLLEKGLITEEEYAEMKGQPGRS